MNRKPRLVRELLGFSVLSVLPLAFGDAAGQYHFDEAAGAGVAQDAIGAADAVLSGAAAFVPGGVAGNALQLTRIGNGKAVVGNHFNFTGDFSIVCWIKMVPGFTESNIICSSHVAGFFNGYFLLNNVNVPGCHGEAGKAGFYQAGPCNSDPRSTTLVNDGQWHQVVGVHRAGNKHRVYVDGSPAEDFRLSTNITYAAMTQFVIGGFVLGATPTGSYTGWIDELQVYPHLLTDAQIDYLFHNPTEAVDGALGDMNCDGFVTVSDIGPFVLALTNPAGYANAFPTCEILHGDLTLDNFVTVGDIASFVSLLVD